MENEGFLGENNREKGEGANESKTTGAKTIQLKLEEKKWKATQGRCYKTLRWSTGGEEGQKRLFTVESPKQKAANTAL